MFFEVEGFFRQEEFGRCFQPQRLSRSGIETCSDGTELVLRVAAGLQPQVGSASDVPVEFADLGRVTRKGISTSGRLATGAVLDNLREGVQVHRHVCFDSI
jgi:hypothetical protein